MPTDSQTIAAAVRKRPIRRHFTICNQKQSATQRESRIKPRKMPPFRPPRPAPLRIYQNQFIRQIAVEVTHSRDYLFSGLADND